MSALVSLVRTGPPAISLFVSLTPSVSRISTNIHQAVKAFVTITKLIKHGDQFASNNLVPGNHFITIGRNMSSYDKHIFQHPEEKDNAIKSLEELNWVRVTDKEAIKKSFAFKNFVQAFSFMTSIALEAEKIDHHPEWFNVYNRVEITLTSHFCNGVSLLDIRLARTIDNIYAKSAKD